MFKLIHSLPVIFLIIHINSYPINTRQLARRDDSQQDYFASVSNGQFSISAPTNTIDFSKLPTPTSSTNTNNSDSDDTDFQDKGFFGAIGKFFKAIFHIGESATTKLLKKSMPIFKSARAAKLALPSTKFVDGLSKADKLKYLRSGQEVINKNKNIFERLQNNQELLYTDLAIQPIAIGSQVGSAKKEEASEQQVLKLIMKLNS